MKNNNARTTGHSIPTQNFTSILSIQYLYCRFHKWDSCQQSTSVDSTNKISVIHQSLSLFIQTREGFTGRGNLAVTIIIFTYLFSVLAFPNFVIFAALCFLLPKWSQQYDCRPFTFLYVFEITFLFKSKATEMLSFSRNKEHLYFSCLFISKLVIVDFMGHHHSKSYTVPNIIFSVKKTETKFIWNRTWYECKQSFSLTFLLCGSPLPPVIIVIDANKQDCRAPILTAGIWEHFEECSRSKWISNSSDRKPWKTVKPFLEVLQQDLYKNTWRT